MEKAANFLKKLYADKFNRYLLIALFAAGIFLFLRGDSAEVPEEDALQVHFFYNPLCSHCKEQKEFNNALMEKYNVSFVYHDTSSAEEAALLVSFAKDKDVPEPKLAVPATFMGDNYIIGFESADTTGTEIEEALKLFLAGEAATAEKSIGFTETVNIPFLGEISVRDYSLPMLAIILGLVDGFNPCAMWVLVYLISLIVTLNDKRKMWFLVGSFVLASGVLYFLFMSAWLNAFLLLGYVKALTIIIGLAALGVGISNIRSYIKTKGALVCEVGDEQSKQGTIKRMEKLVTSPITLATVAGIIVLAFVVNSIEFVCSSFIPAIFTHVLAISELSALQHYSYILLYDLFFMLDDLIIFGLAVFAVNSAMGTRYAKYCKLIGGVVLIVLGIVITFAPNLLH